MTSISDAAPAWPLLGPLCVADDVEDACDGKAAAHTSIGREVEFWLEGKRIWLLHTSNLDTPDPYGGDPIRSVTEVIFAHAGLILLRLHTQHRNFPTDYFVYDWDRVSSRASLLPEIEPAIHATSSMGLLRLGNDGYVAANLRAELNPETAKLEMFLRCISFGGEEWSKHKVNIIPEDDLWGWQTGQVIPLEDTLLWVNLSRGILWSSKLRPSKSEDAPSKSEDSIKFFFVPLPEDLQPPQDNTTCDRPESFRTVGCCNRVIKLGSESAFAERPGHSAKGANPVVKLVNLTHDGVAGRVRIWTWNWSEENNSNAVWEEQPQEIGLDYTKIGSEMKVTLTTDNLPCFPVLSADQSNTLYLTLPEECRPWLLCFDLEDGKLKDYVEYPSFYDHRNPPYPSDLGIRKPAGKKNGNETPIVLNACRGLQTHLHRV